MTEIKQRLFDAFKADHALLGSGFYTLSTYLRDGDIAGAKVTAAKIDADAGPHIAFEEEEFYPALKRFITQAEMDDMYADHERGRVLLENILAIDESAELTDAFRQELLTEVQAIESHISDCGELFGLMGGLDEIALQGLLDKLLAYRLQAPNWLSRSSRVAPGANAS